MCGHVELHNAPPTHFSHDSTVSCHSYKAAGQELASDWFTRKQDCWQCTTKNTSLQTLFLMRGRGLGTRLPPYRRCWFRPCSKPFESAVERAWWVCLYYERKECLAAKALIQSAVVFRQFNKSKKCYSSGINIFQCSFDGCFHLEC